MVHAVNGTQRENDAQMKDMKLTYRDSQGRKCTREFGTIMDFMDEYVEDTEHEGISGPRNTDAETMFFENPKNVKRTGTMQEMYRHCRAITS